MQARPLLILLQIAVLPLALAGCAVTPVPHSAPLVLGDDRIPCVAAPGHYTEYLRNIATRKLRISGTLDVTRADADPKWATDASIYFRDRPGKLALTAPEQQNAPGLALIVQASTDHFRVVFHDGTGSSIEMASGHWNGQPRPFTLTLTDSGLFTVSAAGAAKSQELGDFKLDNVDFTCSAGAVTFSIVAASDP
jgi:hypothetical protein